MSIQPKESMMQKEFLIETRTVTDEKGTLLNLKYYLIEEEASPAAAPLYRICVKKSLSEHPGVEESASTPPVSDSETRARQLLRRLITNAVTPVCLLEIVDDIMTKEDMQAS